MIGGKGRKGFVVNFSKSGKTVEFSPFVIISLTHSATRL